MLLSNHQTWSIAATLLSRTYHSISSGSIHISISDKRAFEKRRRALLFAPGHEEERYIERVAREAFTEALHDLLKHRGLLGLIARGDSYVSVRELLNYQHFRMLSFANLQKVVNEDRWHRFELLYEPLKGRDVDSWWIRVKDIDEKDVTFDPILSTRKMGPAIYGTTLQAWKSYISLKGISRRNDNHIQISRGVPLQDFFTSEAPLSKQVLIHINVRHAIRMGIRFFLVSKPSPSLHESRASLYSSATDSDSPSSPGQTRLPSLTKLPIATHYKNKLTWIITQGNEFGFLPPECFSKVEVVKVKRKVLWTSDEGVVEREPSDENEEDSEEAILDSDMESAEDATNYMAVDTRSERGFMTEHVEVTERDLDQFFINLPIDHQTRVVHSDLKKEALSILSS